MSGEIFSDGYGEQSQFGAYLRASKNAFSANVAAIEFGIYSAAEDLKPIQSVLASMNSNMVPGISL